MPRFDSSGLCWRARTCAALFHFNRRGPTSSTSGVPQSRLPLSSCPFSSWHLWLQPLAHLEISVAGNEQRRRALCFNLPGLSEDQGDETCATSCPSHWHALVPFFSHPRRPVGGLRLHSCLHSCRPVYAMACRLPSPRYFHRHLHRHPCRMDLWFLCPCQAYLRLRLPIYFLSLVRLLSLPWHRAHHDHRLTPSVQQVSRVHVFGLTVGDHEDNVSVASLKPLLA